MTHSVHGKISAFQRVRGVGEDACHPGGAAELRERDIGCVIAAARWKTSGPSLLSGAPSLGVRVTLSMNPSRTVI